MNAAEFVYRKHHRHLYLTVSIKRELAFGSPEQYQIIASIPHHKPYSLNGNIWFPSSNEAWDAIMYELEFDIYSEWIDFDEFTKELSDDFILDELVAA